MNIISETDKPIVKKTVVVYAGRFQPFHKGHYAAYKRLVDKFGQDSVYIGTSNDTNDSKSPFNFNEKKKIATTMFGIPSNHFVNIKNPYKPVEILKNFDGKTTQYIAAVGEKDATRLHGKYFKPYQGKAGYGYEEIGYVWPVPAEQNPISGTDVRKGLGGDEEGAKKFFLKAYPRFNKEIFQMITDKIKSLHEAGPLQGAGMAGSFGPKISGVKDEEDELTEDGFPGGVITGLVSPGGYINGAPKPKDVAKTSKKIHKNKDTDTNKDYVYDPIAELVGNKTAEILFNQFIFDYFEDSNIINEKGGRPNTEKPSKNPIMDKDIKYKKTSGEEGTIKVKDALRLKKDHPAHIQATKMLGTEKPVSNHNKSDKETDKKKTTNGDKDKKGDEPQKAEPQKLPAAEFKSDAEKKPKDKEDTKSTELKNKLDSEISKLDTEDRKTAESMNNPESPERQETKSRIKGLLQKGLKGIDNAARAIVGGVVMGVAPWLGGEGAARVGNKVVDRVKDVVKHKWEQISNVGSAISSKFKKTKSGKKGLMGVVKGEDGEHYHYTDFQKKDENGNPATHKEPVYKKNILGKIKKDEDGNPIQKTDKKGNPKYKHHPIPADDLSPEHKELFHKSVKAEHDQHHACMHTAIEAGVIFASMATAGAAGAAIGAAKAGAASHTVGHAALHGANIFGHGAAGFGHHLAVDIGKHTTAEVLGVKKAHHAGALGVGHSVISALVEFNKSIEKQALLFEQANENSDEKLMAGANLMKSLQSKALEMAADYKMSDEEMLDSIKRYNSKKQQKAKDDILNMTSKMGINESVSLDKAKTIKDFVDYASERLKLKDKPKVKLLLDKEYANQKSSLGGYSPATKDIYVVVPGRMTADICRTIAHELVHRKQDEMNLIKNEEEAGKTGSPIENQANAVAGILLRDYGKLNKEIYFENKILSEGSAISGEDDQPNGAWLPKGARRKLGADDGVNKTDYWFHNGGYIQLEYPEADQILGDDDENQIYVKYITKNVPRQTGGETKFDKGEDKVKIIVNDKKIINEMGRNDIHFKNIYSHYINGDAKIKQKIAKIITGNPYAKIKEIVKDMREMDHNEIEEIEDQIGISLYETIKRVGDKYVVYPENGGKRLGTHDSLKSAKKQLAAIEINKEEIEVDVEPGDEVLMGKFKNKKVQVKDIGKDQYGMPTINGKQATTFRTIDEAFDYFYHKMMNEGNEMSGVMQDDQSYRSPYANKWDLYDRRGETHANIVGYTVHSQTSDHYKEKKKGVVLPSKNPTEENGPGKRWIHPVKF